MVDQVKLNDGDMICHLIKVSSWLRDAALFLVAFAFYPTKSVDPNYICIFNYKLSESPSTRHLQGQGTCHILTSVVSNNSLRKAVG